MAKIERFEDLIAWRKARDLTREAYRLSKTGSFKTDFRLASQLQSAAVSVMANIAEGFERGRRAEFHQFLSIAKGSCGEVRSHLYVAYDVKYINESEFKAVSELAEEVSKIINGLRSSLNGWSGQERPVQH